MPLDWSSGVTGGLSLLAAAPKNAPADPGANIVNMIWLIGIPILLYLIVLRPSQTQEKKRRELLNALKKNDRVVTAGGMIGTVVSVDKDRVVLRVDDDRGVKIAFRKAGIVEVIDAAAEKPAETATTS
jgi:preprotein translocase subunit YajC